ncbi:hypothetical protein SDC9_163351 [bioreactor metagenome]|uniref:Protein CotJB domain-containing protein n=1 Tax=bioreactor metagenome TaxID=1076179 RepID=A0A645FVC3_9ZZZZ
MNCEKQMAMLRRLQEMEFVAVELNLYLDTHPCDTEAINDYNCAVERLRKIKKEYEEEYGMLMHFGHGGYSSKSEWSWVKGPWPWEV